MEKFQNRQDAGKVLAECLKGYANRSDVIVLALPRGGVPIAYEIANALSVELDIFVVRKLGVPGNEELAMGAIATGDCVIFNNDIIKELDISEKNIDLVIQHERLELDRRNKKYRGDKKIPNLKNKIVILVDDGVATGATMRAAIMALRQQQPASIMMAVPVAEKSTCDELTDLVNEIVCPLQPNSFYAVGAWYEDFPQVEDEEVIELLFLNK